MPRKKKKTEKLAVPSLKRRRHNRVLTGKLTWHVCDVCGFEEVLAPTDADTVICGRCVMRRAILV